MSGWSKDNETILEVLAQKAFLTSQYHERLYYMYNSRLKYIKIPIIVISGINSVIAVGLADYVNQNFISATNSVLALVCGVLGSIELFLKVSDNMVISLTAARELYVLHIEIRKTLRLRADDRGVDAKTYLDNVYTRYVDIIQNSKLVIRPESEHDFTDTNIEISDKIKQLSSLELNGVTDGLVEKMEDTWDFKVNVKSDDEDAHNNELDLGNKDVEIVAE